MSSKLEKKVMGEVYCTYVVRYIRAKVGLKLCALIAILTAISSSVSLKNVFSNMPNMIDILGMMSFFTDAFVHTDMFIQLFTAGFLVVLCMFIFDISQMQRLKA